MTKLQLSLVNAAIILISIIVIGALASYIRNFSVRSYTQAFGSGVALFIDSKLTFIGVIHHELSHMLLAILSGAKIQGFELFKFSGDSLGTVNIITRGPWILRAIQKSLSGMAPILCGMVSLYSIYNAMHIYTENGKLNKYIIVFIVLAMCISYHMSMSSQDMKVAFIGIPIIYLIAVVICYITTINMKNYFTFIEIIIAIQLINLIIPIIVRCIHYIIFR